MNPIFDRFMRKFGPKILDGFEVATSENLPSVNTNMLANFLVQNCRAFKRPNVNERWFSKIKPDYQHVEYVQLNRDGDICKMCALIRPLPWEPRYRVHVEIDESNKRIVSSTCEDCAYGECNHGVTVLFWTMNMRFPMDEKIYFWKMPDLDQLYPLVRRRRRRAVEEST